MAERAALRAGVIGVGHLGRFHAEKYSVLDGVELIAVCDLDAERAAEAGAALHCRATTDSAELLAQVDVVSIAVPTLAHAEVAREAAAAGVHMLIEKPLAASSQEALAIAEATTAAGVLVQVGHLERFNPVVEEMGRIFSHPRFIECHRLAPFAGRGTDTDVVFDVMIHDLDLIRAVVGRAVVSVEAVGVSVLSPKVDIANARLRFEGGCIANVTASRVSLKRERKLRVFQEDTYVSMDFDARSALIARRRDDLASADAVFDSPLGAIHAENREFGDADPLKDEIAAFVAAVRDGTAPVVGLEEGIEALRIAERVLEVMEQPDSEGEGR